MGRKHRRTQAPAAWRGRWGTWVGKPEGPPGQESKGAAVVISEAGPPALAAPFCGDFAAVEAAEVKAMGASHSSFTRVSIPVFSFQKRV